MAYKRRPVARRTALGFSRRRLWQWVRGRTPEARRWQQENRQLLAKPRELARN